MKNKVNQFIESFNGYLTYRYKDLYSETEYLITEIVNKNYKTIKDLLFKFNFPERGRHKSFVPYDKILQNNVNPNWISFAEYPNYNMCYVLDNDSNEIFLVDLDTNEIDMYCAPNESIFFEIFSILFKAHSEPRDQTKMIKLHASALEILNDSKFEKFASYIFGV